jgi:putative ABC transport system substrate-binding protein
LLHELIPHAGVIALLANPTLPESARMIVDAQEATRSFGQQLLILNASTPREINAAFATARQQRVGALYVGGDPFFTSRRQQIVALATRDTIPDMYANREFVVEGGLMSYGNDVTDPYRQAGLYVGRILKGDNPADLPVMQSTRFEFVLNIGTAKALGLDVSPSLSARADEVIE